MSKSSWNIYDYFKYLNKGVYAFTGGAGAGKSTITDQLSKLYDIKIIHFDEYFIGSSQDRKILLLEKSKSIPDYIDMCNQYNWWNWEKIEKEIKRLVSLNHKYVFLEGAILGPSSILKYIDIIFFIVVESKFRFSRLFDRDWNKRSFIELIDRFLITEYSENLYYKNILSKTENNIIYINSEGKLSDKDYCVNEDCSIPLKIKI